MDICSNLGEQHCKEVNTIIPRAVKIEHSKENTNSHLYVMDSLGSHRIPQKSHWQPRYVATATTLLVGTKQSKDTWIRINALRSNADTIQLLTLLTLKAAQPWVRK